MARAVTALAMLACVAVVTATGAPLTWQQPGHDMSRSYTAKFAPKCLMNNQVNTLDTAQQNNVATGMMFGPKGDAWYLTETQGNQDDDDRNVEVTVVYVADPLNSSAGKLVDNSKHFMQPVHEVFAVSNDGTSAVVPTMGFGDNYWALVAFAPDNVTTTRVGPAIQDHTGDFTGGTTRNTFMLPDGGVLVASQMSITSSDDGDVTNTASAALFSPELENLWVRDGLTYVGRFVTQDGQYLIGQTDLPAPVFDDDDTGSLPEARVWGLNTTDGTTAFNVTVAFAKGSACTGANFFIIGVAMNGATPTVWATTYNSSQLCVHSFELLPKATTATLKETQVWLQKKDPTFAELQFPAQQFVSSFGSPVLYLVLKTVLSPYQHAQLIIVDPTTRSYTDQRFDAAIAGEMGPVSMLMDSDKSVYACFGNLYMKAAAGKTVWTSSQASSCSQMSPLTMHPSGVVVSIYGSGNALTFGCSSDTPNLRG